MKTLGGNLGVQIFHRSRFGLIQIHSPMRGGFCQHQWHRPPRHYPYENTLPLKYAKSVTKAYVFVVTKNIPQAHCKGRFLLLIGEEDDETMGGDPVVVEDYHTDEEVISGDVSVLNTMIGPGSPRSLQLTGNIKSSSCLVLIDSGSTHNFITPAIVERLQLPTKSITPFQVYIGNGDTLGCQHVCHGVEVCMQGLTFAVDLHVLRIVGPDVVLGVQWLQSLGSVTHDYSKSTMEFQRGSTIVTLKGDSSLNNQPISFNQLQAMVTNGDIQTLYEIHHINTTNNSKPTQIQPTLPPFPKPLQDLLLEFSMIPEPPKTLPPHSVFDNKIHLLPNSKPVNVRPYRYPYFQKSEIEKLVREILDQGIMRPSRSPFSSPIMLVLKKDGTYRFCVDYRALNAITV
nr:Transposon Ty3-G Gag-Pol polyprotein [Ipomoea batatas]